MCCTLLLFFFSVAPVSAISTDTLTFKGNVFVVRSMADTVTMLNQQTMEVETVINNPSPIPVKMNWLDIYGIDEVQKKPGVTENTLKFYLLNKMSNQVAALSDGIYRMVLNSVVIDARGKVVFYDFIGMERRLKKGWVTVPGINDDAIAALVGSLLEGTPVYTPATLSGAKVACRMSDDAFQKPFFIEKGVAYPYK